MVIFITQFRHYLLGKEFLLRTDCSSLRWIMSFKSPTDQMARWLEVLSQYNFKIEHRSGKKHVNADSLSRIPCDPEECQCYDRNTIIEDLPCEGCETCLKKHEMWSDFSQFDDTVPLFSKGTVTEGQNSASRAGISRISCQKTELWTWVYLIMQLQVVKLWSCVHSLCTGIVGLGKYCRYRVSRLRFHQSDVHETGDDSSSNGDNANDVQNQDVKSTLGQESTLTEKVFHRSYVGGLNTFSTVNCSPEKMRKFQQQDPDISFVVNWLKADSQRPPRDVVAGYSPSVRNYWLHWDLLILIDGVLFRKYITSTDQECLLLVVPKVLQKEILLSAHDSVTGAHLGINKTLSKITRRFHWYKMRDSVKLHIKQCEKCAFRKRPNKLPRSPLTEYTVGYPMDRISTDIMGPLPQTTEGHKFILVVMCNFTKWVELYPLKDIQASTVADKIVYEFL